MTEKALDLGFCPRCKDSLGNLTRRIVGGVAFCRLCAWHVKEDEVEREKWVKWAREYVKIVEVSK